MKKQFNRMDLLCFMFVIFSHGQANAQQCIALFSEKKSKTPQHLAFSSRIKIATSDLDNQLSQNYNQLSSVSSNLEKNLIILNIVDLNNRALEIFEAILSKESLFASAADKKFQNKLIKNVLKVFDKQGLPSQLVGTIIRSRVELKNALFTQAQMEQPTAPIGFLHPTPSRDVEPAHKTIGFNQNSLQSEPYGRNVDQHQNSTDHPEVAEKAPIGFIHSKNNSVVAKPFKSIGFIQSEDAVDVSYTLSLAFDFEHSTFISFSGRQPMGFNPK